jgi:hypothetical protein
VHPLRPSCAWNRMKAFRVVVVDLVVLEVVDESRT